MTARERTKQIRERMQEWGAKDIPNEEWTAWVEQEIEEQITAAVAEEREACAQILDDVYYAWVEGDYSPGEAFESAKEKIRHGARCNKPDGGTK